MIGCSLAIIRIAWVLRTQRFFHAIASCRTLAGWSVAVRRWRWSDGAIRSVAALEF